MVFRHFHLCFLLARETLRVGSHAFFVTPHSSCTVHYGLSKILLFNWESERWSIVCRNEQEINIVYMGKTVQLLNYVF